jgi:hypothetical protein
LKKLTSNNRTKAIIIFISVALMVTISQGYWSGFLVNSSDISQDMVVGGSGEIGDSGEIGGSGEMTTIFGIYSEDQVDDWTPEEVAQKFKELKLGFWIYSVESEKDVDDRQWHSNYLIRFAEECRRINHYIEVHPYISPHYGWDDEGWWSHLGAYLQALQDYPELMQGWQLYLPEWFGNLKWPGGSADEWEYNYFTRVSKAEHSAAHQRFYDLVHQYGGKVAAHAGPHLEGITVPSDLWHNAHTWPFLDETECSPSSPDGWNYDGIAYTIIDHAQYTLPDVDLNKIVLSQGMWEEGCSDPDHSESDSIHCWNAQNTEWSIRGCYEKGIQYFAFTAYLTEMFRDNEPWQTVCKNLIEYDGETPP